MRKWSIIATGGVLAAVTLGFQGSVSAAAAEARGWPTGCTYRENHANGAMAKCENSNGGHYKASANCERWDGGGIVVVDAPRWRTNGWSQVFCPAQTKFKSAGIITKST